MSVPASLQPVHAEQVASAGIARLGIFGENGSGKTRLLSTIPPSIPTLVVSADEENVDPLRGFPHIFVVKVTAWDDLDLIYRAMRGPDNPFKAIAFDTWTRIQALALNKVVGYTPPPEEAMRFITDGPPGPKGWDAWAKIGALSAEGMTRFLGLHMHTILTFQVAGRKQKVGSADDTVDKADDLPWILGPSLTPVALRRAKEVLKLIGYLYVDTEAESAPNGALNLGALTEAGGSGVGASYKINPTAKEVRRLLVGRHDRYATKGPSDKIGYVVTDPTWDKLAPAWGA